jgi:hypothetical protein
MIIHLEIPTLIVCNKKLLLAHQGKQNENTYLGGRTSIHCAAPLSINLEYGQQNEFIFYIKYYVLLCNPTMFLVLFCSAMCIVFKQ